MHRININLIEGVSLSHHSENFEIEVSFSADVFQHVVRIIAYFQRIGHEIVHKF